MIGEWCNLTQSTRCYMTLATLQPILSGVTEGAQVSRAPWPFLWPPFPAWSPNRITNG